MKTIFDRPKRHMWGGGIEQRCNHVGCEWFRKLEMTVDGLATSRWQYQYGGRSGSWATLRRVPHCGSRP